MALHFERSEYAARLSAARATLKREKLDALLIFAQESLYYLTGFDTSGFVFFQCVDRRRSTDHIADTPPRSRTSPPHLDHRGRQAVV